MASTVDVAITNLLLALDAAPALAGIRVFDGPPTEEVFEWVAVGWTPGELTSVSATYEWASLGAKSQTEQFDVLCSLRTGSGDPGLSAPRARAVALRDAVGAVIAADVTLGGAVEQARMSTADLVQELTERGPAVGYTFRVTCQATIAS